MKRSYGSTNQPPPPPPPSYQSAPPLPPGPPPPPPQTPNPYPAYGYAYPPAAAPVAQSQHPQYPGYGYGSAAPPPAAPNPYGYQAATPYAAQGYAQQHPGYVPAPSYPQAYPTPPAHQPQQIPQSYSPYATTPQSYAPVPSQSSSSYSHGPPPIHQHAAVQQAYATSSSQSLIGPVQGSPGGAPPYKRPRYDGGPQPVAALPPLGANQYGGPPASRGGQSGGGGGGGRGGGYPDRERNDRGPSDRGPSDRGSRHYSNDGYDGYGDSGGRSPLYSSYSGGGGGGGGSHRDFSGSSHASASHGSSYRGRGGSSSSYDARGGRGGSYTPRGSSAPISSGYGSPVRGSDRGGRGGRGSSSSSSRPVSALPGRGGYNGPRDESSTAGSSGTSAVAARGGYDSLPKGPRSSTRGGASTRGASSRGRESRLPDKKGRTWTAEKVTTIAREDSKKTLTDFRIEALSIRDLEWEWKVEPIKAVVAAIVESLAGEEKLSNDDDIKAEESAVVDGDEETKNVEVDMSFEFASMEASMHDSLGQAIALGDDEDVNEERTEDIKPDQAELNSVVIHATETASEERGDEKVKVEVIKVEPELIVEEPRKDGKHKRDEEDDSGDVDSTDVAAAKKVKPDTGEIVTLSTTATALPSLLEDPSHLLPSTLPLPTKPTVSTNLEGVPTGPRAGADLSAAPRETSRLRIYFASPIITAAPLPSLAKIDEVKSVSDAVLESSSSVEVSVVEVVEKPAAEEELISEAVVESAVAEDEDIDGVDVDGEPIVIVVEVPVQRDETVEEAIENDDDEVASALLARGVTPQPQVESDAVTLSLLSTPSLNTPREMPVHDSPDVAPASTNGGDSIHDGDVREVSVVPTETGAIPPPDPSADRISISYARNSRRIVLDAETIEKVAIFRAEGRIEVTVLIRPATIREGDELVQDDSRVCKGILIEASDEELDDYVPIDRPALESAWRESDSSAEEVSPSDRLLPPIHHLLHHTQSSEGGLDVVSASRDSMTIVVHLDRLNPLSEPRWVKTGDVEGWVGQVGLANGMSSGWTGKITVTDPDPPPTIQHALEMWATSSTTGTASERATFVADHLANNIDNCFEILLRLTRGDRATPSHYAPHMQAASVGALAATLSAPYAEHQTQVSLAVLAMFRLSVETAVKAGIGKEEVEKQVAEIVRGIPYHLIFKSLDSMYRESKSKAMKGKKKK